MCWMSLPGTFLLVAAVAHGADGRITHRKLSGPMVSGVIGDVVDLVISPDGGRVLYLVTRDTEVFGGFGPKQLHVAPVDDSETPITAANSQKAICAALRLICWILNDRKKTNASGASITTHLRGDM